MSDPRQKAEWIKGIAHWREGAVALISVAFTWRLPEARRLGEYYRAIGCTKVRVGGPGTFTMRKYLAEAMPDAEIGGSIPDTMVRHNPMATRASYGCPVGCHFCIVPKMDGKAFTLLPDFPVRPKITTPRQRQVGWQHDRSRIHRAPRTARGYRGLPRSTD